MLRKIGTDDMRRSIGEVLDRVNLRGDEFIIERKHKPLAALIPVAKLKALTQFAKSYALDMISEPLIAPKEKIDEAEIDALADEAKHKSRKKIVKGIQKRKAQ